MKIAHISDIHIRNLKYHDDYKKVFNDLYDKLEKIRPDLIINTGDTAHTKTQLSPEFVQMCSEHFRSCAMYAPLHIILGNHDLNLVNPDRQDAISPIVDNLKNSTAYPIFLHKKSGRVNPLPGVNLWVFSCADEENYPTQDDWDSFIDDINIGLYHGAIRSSVTDMGWELSDEQETISLFSGLDYVLLGDIHKRQFLDADKRISYAGSLIQQNFGEDTEKGFLLWDIDDKLDFDVKFIELKGNKKFYTIKLDDDLKIPNMEIEQNSRIRIISPRQFTIVEQKTFEKEVKKKFNPSDVISLVSPHAQSYSSSRTLKKINNDDLRDLVIQEKLIKGFFKNRDIKEDVMSEIIEMNKKFQQFIEKEEEVTRNVSWKIKSLAWNNMYNYGEGNIIDFSKIKGVTGLFAPNSSGKSSLINIILETLFDKTTNGTAKNISLINDNKQSAQMIANVEVGEEDYVIERMIEKIEFGKRKGDVKEWGKTNLNFYLKDDANLNGILRSETEKNIRKLIGKYDDFILTSLLAQSRDDDIIKCKETDRRKILYRFMDLDIFEQKEKLAKDESKEFVTQLKLFEDNKMEDAIKNYRFKEKEYEKSIVSNSLKIADAKIKLENNRKILKDLENKKIKLDEKISLNIENLRKKRSIINEQFNSSFSKFEETIDKKQNNEKLITEFNEKLLSIDLKKYKQLQETLKTLKIKYENLKKSEASQKNKLNVIDNEIKILSEVPCGNSFPACKFLINANKSKNDRDECKNSLDDISKDVISISDIVSEHEKNNYEKKINAFDLISNKIKELENENKTLELKIENANLQLQSIFYEALLIDKNIEVAIENEEALKHNEQIDKQINEINKEFIDNQNLIEKINVDLTKLNREAGSNETVLRTLTNELLKQKEIKKKCEAYEHYIEAMGKHGIAYTVLVDKLPLINEEINKILTSIADFNVFIEHDESDQAIKLYMKYDDYRSRQIELAGGAEKMLSSIAIRTALLSMTNLPKTNMFIIDEGFGSLDAKNLENIQKMFDYLKSIFDHVIIISHIDQMKDIVDNSIEISFDNERYSHIEIT